jgi:hypothetical protein
MMKLLDVHSVVRSDDADVLIVECLIESPVDGVEAVSYCLRFDDPHGLAPAIRDFIGWIDQSNPPMMGN